MKRMGQSLASPHAAKVQRKAAGPSRRHGPRQAAHEAQADDAAHAFVQGRTGLAQGLTPAPAAGFVLPSSVGQPLPGGLRGELERAFSADLRDVRLHLDEPARQAAARLGALAFASGHRLYFGTGRFDPTGEAGRRLIAHEIAHTLQQAGRPTSGERWRVVAGLAGEGEVQCDPDTPELQRARYEQLLRLHRAGAEEGNTDFDQVEPTVRAAFGGRLPVPALPAANAPQAQRDFVATVTAGQYDARSLALRGWLVDVLKVAGCYDAVMQLIETDTNFALRAVVEPPEFGTFLRRRASTQAWAARLFTALPDLRRLWPDAIVGAFTAYIFQPRGDAQASSVIQQAFDAKRADWGTGLSDGDRVRHAWRLLVGLDRERVAVCNEVQRAVAESFPGEGPVSRRLIVARRLSEHFNRLVVRASTPAHLRDLATALAARADQAVQVFEPVVTGLQQGFARLTQASDAAVLDEPANPLLGRPVTYPLGLELRNLMRTRLELTVPRDAAQQQSSDAFPSSEAYAASLVDYANALNSVAAGSRGPRRGLESRVNEALYAAASAARPDMQSVREIALVMAVVDVLKSMLRTYSPAADDLTPHFADERRMHAVRLARAHAWIGFLMGWPVLIEAARPYLRTLQPLLHLASEWEPDPNSRPDRMEQDFVSNINRRVLYDAPLTIRHIARWFRIEHARRERALLLELLAGQDRPRADTEIPWRETMARVTHDPAELTESMLSGEQLLSMRERSEVITDLDLLDPQRFIVRDFDLSAPEGFAGRWADVIANHPKSAALVSRRPAGGAFIFPVQVGRELFCWLTPNLRPLLTFLRRSPEFARYAPSGGPANALDWLNSLSDDQALDEAINRALMAELEPLEAELPRLWRALTTYRRRVLVLQSVQKLQAVIDQSPRAVDPEYLWPEQVAAEVVAFEGTVRPRESGQDDADIQMALLTMGMATQLGSLFTPSRPRERAANQFYQYVLLALSVVRDPSQRARVQAVTHESEPLRNLYDDRQLTASIEQSLSAAKDAMETHAQTVRSSRGFQVTENKRALLPLGRATPVHVGRRNAWVINAPVVGGRTDASRGDEYYIQEIYENFTYYPAYGHPTLGTLRPGASGVYAPPRLVLNGEEVDLSTPQAVEAARQHALLVLMINGEERGITAGDTDMLDRLHLLLINRSLVISLQTTAAIMQTAMEALLLGVELAVPEVAYAETVANITIFVASDEFAEIVRQLKDDPHAVIEQVLTLVRGRYLTPDAIWRFLLLGGQHPLLRAASIRPQPRPSAARTSGRLARVLRGLRNIARRLHRAIERLRDYTRPPLRAVQGNLMQRPRVVCIMRRAVMLAELVVDVLPSDMNFDALDFTQIPADVSENVQRLVEGLARLELPAQLMDNAALVSLLASFTLQRLGLRGRVIERILSGVPVPVRRDDNTIERRSMMDELGNLIAQGVINNSSVDPNNLWRELLPELQGRFVTARDDLVDGIVGNVNALFDRLNPLLPASTRFAPVTRPSGLTEMQIIHTEIDEGADLYRLPALSSPVPTPALAQSSGQPLAPSTRTFYESRLGRDLSHVRIHGGAEGQAATAPLQADALTSGSHVYLSPSVAAGSLRQQHVLGHELAHVVQQTRPSAPGHGMPPRRGLPGLGVRADRASEAAAERVAHAINASQHISASDLDGVHCGMAPQPAVSAATLERIIGELSRVRGAGEFEVRPVAGARRVPGVQDAQRIWSSALTAIRAARSAEHFAAFMRDPNEVKGFIVEQLVNEASTRIEQHVPGIAQLAQRPLAGPRPESGPTTELNPERFVTLLESFIFAARGIAVQLTLGANNVITRVRFSNVHLAWVGGGGRLWDIAFTRSFPSASPAERSTMQREVRQLLTVLGPQPFIWAHGAYEFSAGFKQRLTEEREARIRGAETVPVKREYLQTDSTRADNLSISTHGNLTRRGIGAFHRESHHTTQYLLAEFFGNSPSGTQQAFPRGLRSVLSPGVNFGPGGTVTAISSGANTLQVSLLDPNAGRGNNMPAVLIAATTHQRGNLHVAPQESIGAGGTIEEHGTRTQGFAIKNQFNNALDAVGLAMRDDSAATRTRISDAVRANRPRVEREIYTAAVATYRWMHDRMINRLKEGLRGEERGYYLRIAARDASHLVSPDSSDLRSDYNLTETDMDDVWERAKANNDRVMAAAGWPAP